MDIIRITIGSGNNIIFYINSYLLGAIIIILMIVAIYISRPKKLSLKKAFSIDEAEIGIGHQKIKLVPNEQDIQIAYKLWVELSTRKIGLEIDYEYDLIYEVYRSWYSFFSIARELIKPEFPNIYTNAGASTPNAA